MRSPVFIFAHQCNICLIFDLLCHVLYPNLCYITSMGPLRIKVYSLPHLLMKMRMEAVILPDGII
ncbi:hypothetical protein DWZ56_15070 [Lachnotalea sp. AF33-28]|nr:hypothetical protein DWZ56_15070 [Lachnotalea sp. AF33-28]